MISAYIFVVLKSAEVESIHIDKLVGMKGVVEAAKVYGIYDLVIKVKFKDIKELKNFVENLRKFKEIEKTATMIIAD